MPPSSSYSCERGDKVITTKEKETNVITFYKLYEDRECVSFTPAFLHLTIYIKKKASIFAFLCILTKKANI